MELLKLINTITKEINTIVLNTLTFPVVLMMTTFAITTFGLVIIPSVDVNGNVYHLTFSQAFYFMMYTATTIGYGEIAHFTYTQQLWVIFSIILSVIGWFYLVSTLVKLMTNEYFKYRIDIRSKLIKISKVNKTMVVFYGYKKTFDFMLSEILDKNLFVVVVVENKEMYEELRLKFFASNLVVMRLDLLSLNTIYSIGIENQHLKNIIISEEIPKRVFDLQVMIKNINKRPRLTVFASTLTDKKLFETLDINHVISSREYIAEDIYNLFMYPKKAEIAEFIHGELVLEEFVGLNYEQVNNVLIIGGGKISEFFLEKTKNHELFNISVIDKKFIGKEKMNNQDASNIAYFSGDIMSETLGDIVNLDNFNYVLLLLHDDYLNIHVFNQIKKLKHLEVIMKINNHKNLKLLDKQKPAKILTIEVLETVELQNLLLKPDVDIYKKALFNQPAEYLNQYFNYMKTHFKGLNVEEIYINEDESYALYNYLKTEDKFPLKPLLYDLENIEGEINQIVPLAIIKSSGTVILIDFFNQNYLENTECVVGKKDKIIYVSLNKRANYIFKFLLENKKEFNFANDFYTKNVLKK